ncbi:hypothetical protein LINGRAHAP2_LOCUS32430 [Linum grandiflorum]
MVEVGYFPSNL